MSWDYWMDRLWYIYNTKYYTAVNKWSVAHINTDNSHWVKDKGCRISAYDPTLCNVSNTHYVVSVGIPMCGNLREKQERYEHTKNVGWWLPLVRGTRGTHGTTKLFVVF